jgi:hypothetical protein
LYRRKKDTTPFILQNKYTQSSTIFFLHQRPALPDEMHPSLLAIPIPPDIPCFLQMVKEITGDKSLSFVLL